MQEKKFNAFKDIVADGGMTAILRTIGVIGDSLSSGEMEYTKADGTHGYYDDYDLSWGQFLARKCGVTVRNFCRGGLRAKTFHELAHYGMAFHPDNKCRAYIIALGVNDMNHIDDYSLGFGSYDDVDFNDYNKAKDSFVAQYVAIIQKIKELQPHARIFCMTMPKSAGETERNRENKKKHAEFLHSLREHFDRIYIIDLFNQDYEYDTEDFKRRYRLLGHMSVAGYKMTADVVATYIDHIINENPEDFAHVGLIGTGLKADGYME